MKKICPNCLQLQDESLEQCPTCQTLLDDVEAWKSSRRFANAEDRLEAETIEANAQAGNMQSAYIPEALILEEGRTPVKSRGASVDMTKFVLGVFLSSFVFFMAFLAAYVVTEMS
jgi:hypothetical protein